MKTRVMTLVVCFCVFTANAQNDVTSLPNDSLWNKMAEFEKQSLPQSALAIVNQIYQNALKEGNSSEFIKSLIYQLKFETVIDRDNYRIKIEEIEKLISEDKNKVEQAFLHSIVAQLYQKYYDNNSRAINQRTALLLSPSDPKPDIQEWSANLFFQAIIDHAALSLAPAEMLQQTDISVYKAILEENGTFGNLQSTLYDILAGREINILVNLSRNSQLQNHFPQTKLSGSENFAPVASFVKQTVEADAYNLVPRILKIYRDLLTFRLSKPAENLALLAPDLERLKFVLDNTPADGAGTEYLEALQILEKQYENSPYCIEILYDKAKFYQSGGASDPESIQATYQICKQGMDNYPDYERIGLLKNLFYQITQPNLNVNGQNAIYPGEELEINLNYRNINRLKIEIYKINAPANSYPYRSLRNDLYQTYGKLLTTQEVDLINEIPYISSDTTLKIPVKELGIYEWVIYPDTAANKIPNHQFSVSRLATATRRINSKIEFLVVDRQSGKPVKNAKVDVFKSGSEINFEKVKTYYTDALGIAKSDLDKDETIHFYLASLGADSALVASGFSSSTYFYSDKNEVKSVLDLFTDRSIYRLGQTVYFKGIVHDMQRALKGKNYTVSFYDANNKEISQKKVTTNEFGSFSGSFAIPQGILNGNFSIRTNPDNGYASFSVEDYKRPAFDLKFEKNEDAFALGDTIVVKGYVETYSGVDMQNSNVQYRILRAENSFLRRLNQSVQIAEGNVQTDESGKFAISFFADNVLKNKNTKILPTSLVYTIEVKVTDIKGETQTFEKRIEVGEKSLFVFIEMDDIINKDNLPAIQIDVENREDFAIANTQNTYEIYKLIPKDKSKLNLEKTDWNLGKKVFEGAFQSNEKIEMSFLKNEESGQYRILAKAIDKKGRKAEAQEDFTLASLKDKCPPTPVYEWLITSKTTCEVGESAKLIFGSSTKVYVLYDIFTNDKKVSTSRFELNNENREIEIPFLSSYKDGITVTFSFIKDGKIFKKDLNILKKQVDKELTVKTEVFRDKLTPGGKEEWKISVKDADKNPVVSELLAAMYDASLDKITEHDWYFNPIRDIRLPIPVLKGGTELSPQMKQYVSFQTMRFSYPQFKRHIFIQPQFFETVIESVIRVAESGVAGVGLNTKPKEVSFAMQRISTNELKGISSIDDALAGKISGLDVVDSGSSSMRIRGTSSEADVVADAVQIRRNFDETAFFYPQLKTNEKGETLISFTVPESNTTWKFMALAHTKDLKFGQFETKAISQKQLMVAPNVPRFLRTGDKATVSATVSNLSESAVSGTVDIECFDPNTEQANIIIAANTQNFNLEPGKTSSVSWTFDIPQGIDLTALKIVAKSSSFSDGEQHLIPVLPNRMLVTESLPFDIADGKTQTISFDKWMKNVSPTLENKGMTLEFTGNPIWNVVQALPVISEPQSENVLSWFAAYYSNNRAVQIANSNPKIKQVIEAWTKQNDGKETLHSNLEKNQELKTLLLEETPWVMNAQNETEQKQQLAALFDVNRTDYLNGRAIEKLKSLQTGGGWSWFKGMNPSVSITQWILYGLGNIQESPQNEDIRQMTEAAVNFIDNAFNKRFESFQKRNPQWKETEEIFTYELEYLLVRSLYKNIPLSEETAAAVQFYTSIAEKYWNRSTHIYSRAITAIILQRSGSTKTAAAIIKSLREHATRKAGLGMFWANNNTSAFMFQSATCIHTFIMSAFYEVGSDNKEMDEMKYWLLKQKQTQEWENIPATLSAIDILLRTGSNWLDDHGKSVIKWSGETFTPTDATGYLKVFKDAKTLEKSKENTVTVTRESAAPAWGALYRQYFEDLDKIKSGRTGLGVEKSLYIEKTGATGKSLIAISENTPLQTGDKVIVRLIVNTDRDLEFVHLKDMRASCFEPTNQLSGIHWVQNVIYYQTIKDASVNFYFENLPKGTYVFEYPLYVTSKGEYSNGITTIQCLYAPEFISHTSGGKVLVK
jgi:uncharacterized protein YfaS (alpha-2-macroglobulin family)